MAAGLEERERSTCRGRRRGLLSDRRARAGILDLSGTWGAATLGYNHPAVGEAVAGAILDRTFEDVAAGRVPNVAPAGYARW